MTVSDSIRQRVRAQAKNRCVYCLSRQELVLSVLEIEHIIPSGAGGTDDEENLWLACRSCNPAKGIQTQALDPLTNQNVKLFNLAVNRGMSILLGASQPRRFLGGHQPDGLR